jgi:hypothetical protein
MVPLARRFGKGHDVVRPADWVAPPPQLWNDHPMNRRLILTALPSLVVARSALGGTFAFRNIVIEHPWAKPSVTEAAAVFMILRNNGAKADRLVGGTTPLASKVILREFDGTPLEFF